MLDGIDGIFITISGGRMNVNMIKYMTETFPLGNEDVLWEKFMCFMRQILPWEECQHKQLSERQKNAVFVFIYSRETMREGHIGFLDMYRKDISIREVIRAMEALSVPEQYIENIREMPKNFIPIDELAGQCASEEEFEEKMEHIDTIYDEYDKRFYEYGDGDIIKKIIVYVRENDGEFFEYE